MADKLFPSVEAAEPEHTANQTPKPDSAPQPREVHLVDFLTEAEIREAMDLYARRRALGQADFARRFAAKVIWPKMERINAALGGNYDPLRLAFAVEFILDSAVIRARTLAGQTGSDMERSGRVN